MKLNIKGAIISNNDKWIYDLFGMESTAPKDVVESIEGLNEDLDVVINSGGGDVYSGSEIYTALKEYPGKVNIKVVGIAASAASLIAMSGDHVAVSPTAQLMIHNVSSVVAGDSETFEHEAEVLRGFNQSIASAYVDKTSKTESEILELMSKETWLTAENAVKEGFADEVMFSNDSPVALVANAGVLLPEQAIKKVSQLMNQDNTPTINFELDYEKLSNMVVDKLENKQQSDLKENKKIKEESPEPKKNGLGRFFF